MYFNTVLYQTVLFTLPKICSLRNWQCCQS